MYPMNFGSFLWDMVFKDQENGGLPVDWHVEEKYEVFGYGRLRMVQIHWEGNCCMKEEECVSARCSGW